MSSAPQSVFRNSNDCDAVNPRLNKCFLLALALCVTAILSIPSYAVDDPDRDVTEPAVSKTQKPQRGVHLSDPNMAGNLLQTTLGLVVVLVLIGIAAWVFKRFANVQVGAQGRMKVIGGISLGTRERAVLLQVGEQQLLLGVSPGRVQTLHVLEEPLSVDRESQVGRGFSARLQAAVLQRKTSTSKEADK